LHPDRCCIVLKYGGFTPWWKCIKRCWKSAIHSAAKGVDKKEKLWYNNKVVGRGHQEKTSKHGEKPQFERRIGKSESGKARSGWREQRKAIENRTLRVIQWNEVKETTKNFFKKIWKKAWQNFENVV